MKIGNILEAGYVPTTHQGHIVSGFRINNEYGVVTLMLEESSNVSIALTKDHANLDINFVMHLKFNEDTAAALTMSNVAPFSKEDIDVEYPKQMARIQRENERKARERRDTHQSMFLG